MDVKIRGTGANPDADYDDDPDAPDSTSASEPGDFGAAFGGGAAFASSGAGLAGALGGGAGRGFASTVGMGMSRGGGGGGGLLLSDDDLEGLGSLSLSPPAASRSTSGYGGAGSLPIYAPLGRTPPSSVGLAREGREGRDGAWAAADAYFASPPQPPAPRIDTAAQYRERGESPYRERAAGEGGYAREGGRMSSVLNLHLLLVTLYPPLSRAQAEASTKERSREEGKVRAVPFVLSTRTCADCLPSASLSALTPPLFVCADENGRPLPLLHTPAPPPHAACAGTPRECAGRRARADCVWTKDMHRPRAAVRTAAPAPLALRPACASLESSVLLAQPVHVSLT
ncbi:hypothetical protein FB451DRAFT_1398078 [Mycena latifolia]|nr:hypothetical protein FB451DRAFT_1398078 [Mycena latifolia]